jgi:hypothetical protein
MLGQLVGFAWVERAGVNIDVFFLRFDNVYEIKQRVNI